MGQRIILLELNEVPFRVLDAHAQRRPAGGLAQLLRRARAYRTLAEDDTRAIPHGALSPWITWPSVHRGVPYPVHGVTHLGQDLADEDRAHPPVWQLTSRAGVATGVFGSLHSYPLPEDVASRYAFYLPDTFAAGSEAHPPLLERFQAFNLAMVKRSARNVAAGVEPAAAVALLLAAPRLGIRPATLAALAAQLVAERRESWRRGRRRTYQVVLAFDLFMRQLRRTRPRFATFFTNHVASAMHRYWAARFPEDYEESELDDEWRATYAGEIDFAMDCADDFVRRTLAFVEREPDTLLLATSSMGQKATHARRMRSQLYARDLERLMDACGLARGEWSRQPAMEPDVNLVVAGERVDAFRKVLGSVRIEGRPLRFDERDGGFFSLIFGHHNVEDEVVELEGVGHPFMEVGLENVEVDEAAGSTAFHVPEGHLLVYDPRAAADPGERPLVSNLEIAPFVLRRLGIEPPAYMRRAGLLEAAAGG